MFSSSAVVCRPSRAVSGHFQTQADACRAAPSSPQRSTTLQRAGTRSHWEHASAFHGCKLSISKRFGTGACVRTFSVSAESAPADGNEGAFKFNVQSGLYAAAWIAFFGVAAATAPPDTAGYTASLVADCVNPLAWGRVNPVLLAEFQLMGVWPAVYAALLSSEKDGKIKKWPCLLASFFFGAFALLPFLAIRAGQGTAGTTEPEESRGKWAGVFESKATAAVLLASAIGLGVYACLPRDGWSDFWFQDFRRLFATDPFVHTMTLDFFTLSALLPFVQAADMRRRGWLKRAEDKSLLATSALFPIVGPCIYLLARPAPRDHGAEEDDE
eukprot:tig00020610_g11957.t1